jgi:hypothetical protein
MPPCDRIHRNAEPHCRGQAHGLQQRHVTRLDTPVEIEAYYFKNSDKTTLQYTHKSKHNMCLASLHSTPAIVVVYPLVASGPRIDCHLPAAAVNPFGVVGMHCSTGSHIKRVTRSALDL